MAESSSATRKSRIRRASAYALVLMSSMLVVVIGISALTTTRIQGRGAADLESAAAARIAARSAIELGMYMVRENPDWRADLGNGAWKARTTLGNAAFKIDAEDPIDGNPANNYDDPIVIKATGTAGAATQALQATMTATRGNELLEVALHAQGELSITGPTVLSDQWFSSNLNCNALAGASVFADVAVVGSVNGVTYHGLTRAGQAARPTINVTNVINAYTSSATVIDIAALPAGNAEKTSNGGFENGTTGWTAVGSTTVISTDAAKKKLGSFSLLVVGRTAASDGAAQDVTSAMRNQKPFTASAYFRRDGSTSIEGRIQLAILHRPTPASSIQTTTISGPTALAANSFVLVSGTITPAWTGTLVSASLRLNTVSGTESFFVDCVSLHRSDLTSDPYIEGVVLSPNNNPFGSRNALGLYLLDCQDQNLHIRDCRIFGTLVLLAPGSGTIIESSVAWHAAVSNYPALLTDGGMLISMTNTPLSESSVNVNFNPSGSPATYEGLGEDADIEDSYPSRIHGLMMIGGDLSLGGRNDLHGVLLSSGAITIEGTRTDLTYDARYLNNPPPGFDDVIRTVEFQRGSFRPLTN
ncbi:MAG: carbohydrate binding domain-containing protein [Phycisphaerae bacterium]